jgi:hypothetical protein
MLSAIVGIWVKGGGIYRELIELQGFWRMLSGVVEDYRILLNAIACYLVLAVPNGCSGNLAIRWGMCRNTGGFGLIYRGLRSFDGMYRVLVWDVS